MGMGVAFATPVFLAGSAWAQTDPNTATVNSNQQIYNHGLPHQAPAIGLSSIYGLSPCATGASVGISTPLVGLGGAISTIDKDCETRNNAAVTVTALQDAPLAREIFCSIPDFRQASLRLGKPCLVDQRPGAVAAAPPTPTPSTPANLALPAPPSTSQLPPNAAPPAVARPLSASVPAASLPAFCKIPGLALDLYPMCSNEAGTEVVPVPRLYRTAARVRLSPPPRPTLSSQRKASAPVSPATVPLMRPIYAPETTPSTPRSGSLVAELEERMRLHPPASVLSSRLLSAR